VSTYEIVDGVYEGPERLAAYLDLINTQIKDLGNLKTAEGSLWLQDSPIKDLGNLKYVKKNLGLRGTKVKDLGILKSVGKLLYLPDGTLVEDFKAYKKEAEQILKGLTVEDYPLHMNHENWLVRTKINRYLEAGEL
jgi:hypothetical protein